MADSPTREFGRRRPPALDPAPPAKRSGHVALLVMGTLAVGGSAYALMPREKKTALAKKLVMIFEKLQE